MLGKLLKKKEIETLVSVDIGSSTIKLMELDLNAGRPKLLTVGIGATPANCVNNNTITNTQQVAAVIRSIAEANEIRSQRAVVVLPGPCAFTKRVSMAYTKLDDLAGVMAFEANNYIPQSIGPVHLDYQVLSANGTSSMDLLFVAVKDEIIRSYLAALTQAGMEPVIAEVDYFALENMFELNYPDEKNKTVALVNIGARYCSIIIMQNGRTLFTGDVGVGGRLYADALFESLEMKAQDAEKVKQGEMVEGFDQIAVREITERTTEHVASELHRQLGFFWNAAATDAPVEMIFVSGGGAQIAGLVDELSTKTGVPCQVLDSFRGIQKEENFDAEYLSEISAVMAVSVGTALRRLGDKKHAIQ